MDDLAPSAPVCTLPCGHSYHAACIADWVAADTPLPHPFTCPMCRKPLVSCCSCGKHVGAITVPCYGAILFAVVYAVVYALILWILLSIVGLRLVTEEGEGYPHKVPRLLLGNHPQIHHRHG